MHAIEVNRIETMQRHLKAIQERRMSISGLCLRTLELICDYALKITKELGVADGTINTKNAELRRYHHELEQKDIEIARLENHVGDLERALLETPALERSDS